MEISRRKFLERLGFASAATATLATLDSCSGGMAGKALYEVVDGSSTHTDEPPTDQMTYRTNPNTGDRVSILGYGMMRLPQVPADKAQPNGNDLDQEQINRLVDYAMAHGVNYYDTSPAYCKGFSESATGIALSRYPRDKYYIATKLSNFAPQQQTREESIKIFENSLKYLQTSYIDYLLLHSIGGGGMDNFNRRFMDNGILDWLVEQKQKGRIRNLGFSFHGDLKVFDEMLKWHDEGRYHWDFVQIQLNYVDWLGQGEYLYTELAKRNIPAVIMEPLLGGRLAKLPNHVIAHLKQRRPEDSVASWSFRFCGTFPGVMCALSGMTYMEHLQDNIRSYSPLEPLTDEDLAYLQDTAEMIQKYPLIPCNDCKYCMPCPYGLDIPASLLFYNKMVNEDHVPNDQQDPRYKELRRQYLISYDRSVPKLRQADHCVGCNKCVSHCPQNIKIPQQLQRIDKMIEELKRQG